jgi:hypothetical protein
MADNLQGMTSSEWNPFHSIKAFKHHLLVMKRNLLSFYYFDIRRQLGMVLAAAIVLYLFFFRREIRKIKHVFFYLFFSFLLFITGYVLILVIPRYMWAAALLMAFMILLICSEFLRKGRTEKLISLAIFLMMIFLIVKRPVKEIFFAQDRGTDLREVVSVIKNPLAQLEKTYSFDKALIHLADTLQTQNIHGNIASQQVKMMHGREDYAAMVLLCYYLKSYFYGLLTDEAARNEGSASLFQHKIDYYFMWKPNAVQDSVMKKFPVIFTDENTGLKIYRLK